MTTPLGLNTFITPKIYQVFFFIVTYQIIIKIRNN